MSPTAQAAPPADRRPIIIFGIPTTHKATLIQRLLAAHPRTLTQPPRKTTRARRPDEKPTNTDEHIFVRETDFLFSALRHSFVETSYDGEYFHGTGKRDVAERSAAGWIVVLDVDAKRARQAQEDSGLDARYVRVQLPLLPLGDEAGMGWSDVGIEDDDSSGEEDEARNVLWDKIIVWGGKWRRLIGSSSDGSFVERHRLMCR